MRWLWFVLAVLCFAVAFRTHSMGLAFLTLFGGLGFLLMGTLALVSSRIEATGRDASALLGPDEVRRLKAIQDRERAAAEAAGESDMLDGTEPGAEEETR